MDFVPTFRVIKKHKDAILPTKTHVSDSGFDITIISKLKTIGDVTFYDSGIVIEPDNDHYTLLFPRSSISKTGYMMANGVGVIDQSYRGTIIVALRKVDKSMPDLELPCRIAQIVPQKLILPHFEVVETISNTSRGDGGFGSTGK